MSTKKRIAVDMDEVIADTTAYYVQLYKEKHGFDIDLAVLEGKEIHQILPEELNGTLRAYINEPGFFRHLPIMEDSQLVMKELYQKYDLYIVSAAMEFKYSLLDKYEWLEENFPFIKWTNIMFCGHKIVNVDIFIDDRSRNFNGFDGRKLLFHAPHNAKETIDYERVHNWQEIGEKLL